MRAALAQDPRVAGIGEPESAMLFRNDEAEQAQIAQPLNELRRLLSFAVPAFEILPPRSQKLIDGIHHHPQNFLVLIAQLRVRKYLILENVPGDQALGDAHAGPYSATRSMTRS